MSFLSRRVQKLEQSSASGCGRPHIIRVDAGQATDEALAAYRAQQDIAVDDSVLFLRFVAAKAGSMAGASGQ